VGGAASAAAHGGAPPWRLAPALRVPGGEPARSRRYPRAHGGGARRAPGRRSHRDDRSTGAALAPREAALMLEAAGLGLWAGGRGYVMLGRYPPSRSAWSRDEESSGLARRWLAELDLADRAAQAYRTLSGGERQRARIAQVLLQDADVLLLDEPLQHLDLHHQARVMRTLSRCASGGKTVLAALHEPGHAVRHCGFAVLLYDAGRASLGRSSDMLTQANLEALYQCRLEAAGTGRFLPS